MESFEIPSAIEQMEKVIEKGFSLITKNLQNAAILEYKGNILAAKIISAKTDYERNEIIKESKITLETVKRTMEE
jgi:hypothetical protein